MWRELIFICIRRLYRHGDIVTNFHSTLLQFLPVSTFPFNLEIWKWGLPILDPKVRMDTDISIAHDELPQIIDAVIYPPATFNNVIQDY
jgi:hypothetical protein